MTRRTIIEHRFVDNAPDLLEDGIVYVSIPYATALHLCACGCGNEVVTPIRRTGWHLIFDGISVSLHPSIGNWSYECQSHYWIRRNRIQWVPSKLSRLDGRKLGLANDMNAEERPIEAAAALTVDAAKHHKLGTRILRWLRGDR